MRTSRVLRARTSSFVTLAAVAGVAVTALPTALLAGCTNPDDAASGDTDLSPGDDADAASGDGAPGADAGPTSDGGAPTDASSPPPANVVIGAETTLASGLLSIYGAHRDRVLYVLFDPQQRTFRIELSRASGGAPKILHQGSFTRNFDAPYMGDKGAADQGRNILTPWHATSPGKFVVAVPAAKGFDVQEIDLATETSTRIDTVGDVQTFEYRDDFLFYWYADRALSGYPPLSLAWRGPSGAIVRSADVWRSSTDDYAVTASGDRSMVVFTGQHPQSLPPFAQPALMAVNAADGSLIQRFDDVLAPAARTKELLFEFAGRTLVLGSSTWTPGGAWKILLSPTEPDVAVWRNGNALFALEQGRTRGILSAIRMSDGQRTVVDVTLAAARTKDRLFYVPTGTTEMRTAPASFGFTPDHSVPDVTGIEVSPDGRWALLQRGPNTATQRNRVWFDKQVFDLGKDAIGHYDDVSGIVPLGSGSAACVSTYIRAVCVSGKGEVASVDARTTEPLATVGANGVVYSAAKDGVHRLTVVTMLGSKADASVVTDTAIGESRATDDALFYLANTGAQTASLVARTLR